MHKTLFVLFYATINRHWFVFIYFNKKINEFNEKNYLACKNLHSVYTEYKWNDCDFPDSGKKYKP